MRERGLRNVVQRRDGISKVGARGELMPKRGKGHLRGQKSDWGLKEEPEKTLAWSKKVVKWRAGGLHSIPHGEKGLTGGVGSTITDLPQEKSPVWENGFTYFGKRMAGEGGTSMAS